MATYRDVSAEDVRASLWFWPSVAAVASLAGTLALLAVRPEPTTTWATWLWPGDGESASALLQTIATSVMTATTLTFSLTVVALQLASQQFSPRLLREFARDRVTQTVLAVLISTFVVAVTGLRGVGTEAPVPVVVVALSLAMGLVSAGALLAFIGHIARGLRVDTMMLAVHRESAAIIEKTYAPHADQSRHADRAPDTAQRGDDGTSIPARASGFVRTVRPRMLVARASRRDLFVQLEVRPGDHVVTGAPLATVWCPRGTSLDDTLEEIADALGEAVEIGFERTSEQDAALGFRQLTDIAVKAISPSINDPVTASHAIGYCADLMTRLQSRELGSEVHRDDQGVARLRTADRDLRYYLDLVCAPIRRFGRADPTVLTALLRMLRDCAVAARDGTQRREIARQARLIADGTSGDLGASDAQSVADMTQRVQLALDGRMQEAYRDRAGETRSD